MMEHDQVRLAFIGAGAVNFGGGEGPWDHASRFERIAAVRCVGAADVDLARARAALAARQAGDCGGVWSEARAFGDWRQMVEAVKPDAVVIGLPPADHGRPTPPDDVELALARKGIAMLVEKPLGLACPAEAQQVADELDRSGALVSVGYMFRYAAAVAAMREVLAQTPGGVRVLLARYDCAYSQIVKADFWDRRRSGGPIIEQATHLIDLARYLGGEVNLDSVHAAEISGDSPKGRLVDMPQGPSGQALDVGVPRENRIARSTVAHWRFAGGALGALAHGVLLHGRGYHAELEVWGDGVRCILEDPYGRCRLGVRRSGSEQTQWQTFDDDPYMTEDVAFIEAVRAGSADPIRSAYRDALQTHRLTWRITACASGGQHSAEG